MCSGVLLALLGVAALLQSSASDWSKYIHTNTRLCWVSRVFVLDEGLQLTRSFPCCCLAPAWLLLSRVMAVARGNKEDSLAFCGLVGIMDPPRASAIAFAERMQVRCMCLVLSGGGRARARHCCVQHQRVLDCKCCLSLFHQREHLFTMPCCMICRVWDQMMRGGLFPAFPDIPIGSQPHLSLSPFSRH